MKTVVYSPGAVSDLRQFLTAERRKISRAVEALAAGGHDFAVEITGVFSFAHAPVATIGFVESEESVLVFALIRP